MSWNIQSGLQTGKDSPESHTRVWEEDLLTVGESFRDTIPSYHVKNLSRNYNQDLKKETESTTKVIEKILTHWADWRNELLPSP